MNLRDSIARLEALGPYLPPTPGQIATIRALVADQHDADELLAALGFDELSPTSGGRF